MKKDFFDNLDRPNHLAQRVQELRAELAAYDANQLAINTGSTFHYLESGKGFFQFTYWQEDTHLSYPTFIATSTDQQRELGVAHQALILYYFVTARPQPLQERWISFAELPDGRFYTQAFQGYTGNVLQRHFTNQIARVEEAVKKLKGEPYPFGDQAYLFWLFPRVPLLLVFWQGDEDFPPNYQILFDASIARFLPTDACAIAGSMLARKLASIRA